jgi:beta-lactamase regulating signal transducer with metallopeptidase domain
MSDVVVTSLLEVLGRTTLWLSVVALLTGIVLRFARPSWPLAHRAAWLLVLLVGWTFLRLPLDLPWYEAQRSAPVLIARTLPLAESAPTEQAPAESVEVIELHTPVAAPSESAVGGTSATVTEPADPVELASASGPEIQRPVETLPWSTVWKQRAAIALLSAWLLGIVVLLTAWLVGYVRFLRLLRSRVAADERWASEWQALLAEAGVRQIPLSMTDDLGPLLCRLPRGFELVISEPLWRELDAPERLAILRHELAHYRRGDVWSSLAARFLALPHWFNPASWWAVNRFDEAAEWACDHAAVGQGETTEYAKVLMRLGQVVGHGRVYGSAVRGRSLARRIRRVLTAPATADSTLKKASLVCIALLLVAASVVQLKLIAKQQTDDPSDKVASDTAGDEKVLTKDEKSATKDAASQPAPKPNTIELNTTEPAEAAGLDDSARQNRIVADRLVEQASRAYGATSAAYLTGNTSLESVYEWSLRWMDSARSAAADRTQRIAAVKKHLERMQELQRRIQILHEAAAKGGDVYQFRMVNFYVTQAEQGLARVQRGGTLQREERESVSDNRQPVVDYEIQIIDVTIKISQLQDQIDQTKINLEVAQGAANTANQLQKGAVSRTEMARIQSDALKARVQLKSLEEQLKLHENKLELLNARARASAKNSGADAGKAVQVRRASPDGSVVVESRIIEGPEAAAAAPLGPVVIPVVPTARPGAGPQPTKQELRYVGKSFSQWQEIAKTELSPVRKSDAIRALAAFGANGFGSEAAAQIVETISGIWDSTEGEAREDSERYMEHMVLPEFERIPLKDSLPVLTKTLISDNKNGQTFALIFLDRVWSNRITPAHKHAFEETRKDPKVVAALEEMEKSKDERTSSLARLLLIRIGAKASGAEPPSAKAPETELRT